MMLYPSINELNTKVDSRYTLVALAAKRARDIISGKPILLDEGTEEIPERPVSIAAHEIAEDLISYKCAEEKGEEFYDAAYTLDNAADASVEESTANIPANDQDENASEAESNPEIAAKDEDEAQEADMSDEN